MSFLSLALLERLMVRVLRGVLSILWLDFLEVEVKEGGSE